MCELRAAGAVAHCPDVRRRGLEALVHLDVAAFAGFNARDVEPDVRRVGYAARRDQQVAALDRPLFGSRANTHANLRAGAAGNPERLGIQHDLDALVDKLLCQHFSHVRILACGELRSPLQYGHTRAEPAHGLRELEADIAAAGHDEVLGNPVELQRFDVSQGLAIGESRHFRNCRASAQVEEDPVTRNPSSTAVLRTHFDQRRRDESSFADDQLGTAVCIVLAVDGNQVIDHLPLATTHALHVDADVARGDAEFRSATDQRRHSRAVDHVLAGEAGDVRTGSADQPALDDDGAPRCPGQRPRDVFSRLATAEYENVMGLDGCLHAPPWSAYRAECPELLADIRERLDPISQL